MVELELILKKTEQPPDVKLWCAALVRLVLDAQMHLVNNSSNKRDKAHFKEAFDDLCSCGAMTRRVCKYSGYEPEWLSSKFRKHVKAYYGAEKG